MTPRSLVPLALAILGLLDPASVWGQTSEAGPLRGLFVGASIATTTFSGAAAGSGSDGRPLRFVPYRPTLYGLVLGYDTGPLRLEAGASTGQPGLAVRGTGNAGQSDDEGLLIVIENALRVRAFTAGVSFRIGRRDGTTLRGSVAALLERWSAPGSPGRTIAGGQTGLAMAVALASRLEVRIEGMLGHTPASPFRQEDLPEGVEQRVTWRRSVGVGVSWKL